MPAAACQPSQGLPAAREVPSSTKVPLERATPLLSCAVGKWLRTHGKTVKPKLSDEQKANLRMCFRMMDADGSGAIDATELGAAFRLLGLRVSRREVEAMLAEVDRDGSGEVEYAEFLEIMTMQLTRLAEQAEDPTGQKAAAGGKLAGSDGGDGDGGDGTGEEEEEGVDNLAAMLPFDVVATAYRRKKLIGALEEGDKDFILSVAEAEEEERRRAAAAAEAAAARHSRRHSGMSSRRGSLALASGASSTALHGVGGSLVRPPPLMSHASFLESLGREERKIIEALLRKHRQEGGEEPGGQAQQRQPQRSPSPAGRAASPVPGGAHLAALRAVGQAAGPSAGQGADGGEGQGRAGGGGGLPLTHHHMDAQQRSRSMPRPATTAALTRPQDYRVRYRLSASLGSAAAAGAAGAAGAGGQQAAAAEDGTEGLLLTTPQFSSMHLGGSTA